MQKKSIKRTRLRTDDPVFGWLDDITVFWPLPGTGGTGMPGTCLGTRLKYGEKGAGARFSRANIGGGGPQMRVDKKQQRPYYNTSGRHGGAVEYSLVLRYHCTM